ncbi:MAG: hypothetical protein JSS43_15690 [Proteobacteria bacterium]|nr:hypothetical protein [Pseudomonadota bacterium]
MASDRTREDIRAVMRGNGDTAEDVAQILHPLMTADDVNRYLTGQPALNEEARGINVDKLMADYSGSTKEVEQTHANDLA